MAFFVMLKKVCLLITESVLLVPAKLKYVEVNSTVYFVCKTALISVTIVVSRTLTPFLLVESQLLPVSLLLLSQGLHLGRVLLEPDGRGRPLLAVDVRRVAVEPIPNNVSISCTHIPTNVSLVLIFTMYVISTV